MCVQSKQIINRSTVFTRYFDKPKVNVPCGTCEECVRESQNEWFIRAYAEFMTTRAIGGRVMFVTLTYNNDNLPYFTDYGYGVLNEVGLSQPCFSYEDIKSFISKVKTYLQRMNIPIAGFKYFICSEYGHDYVYSDKSGQTHKGTQRPHYHALLYFPPSSRIVSNRSLKEVVNKSWKNGFTIYSKESKGGAFVSNITALRYVSKYVSKDFGFYGLPQVNTYLSILKRSAKRERDNYGDTDILYLHRNRERLKNFRHLLPRHYQSQNFGYEYLKHCFVDGSSFEINPRAEEYLAKGIKPLMSEYYYRIPRYVLNKLCYEYADEDAGGYRYLTELGKKIFEMLSEIRISNQTENLTLLLKPESIHKYCNDKDFEKVFKMDSDEFLNTFYHYLGSRTIYDLSVYSVAYRGLKCPFGLLDEPLENFIDNYKDLIFQRLNKNGRKVQYNIFNKPITLTLKTVSDEILLCYDSCPAFEHFEFLLGLVEKLKSFRLRKLRAQKIKESIIKKVKEYA